MLKMKHQQGIPREQLQMLSFESMISKDNPVRFVDSFVDHLDLSKLDFKIQIQKHEGRPSFESKVFLKIYLYGYLNGIRSSRRLEKECERNIELHWLLHSLTPNYHSISDFRKVNPDALRNTFKLFVSFLKDANLIGGTTIAIDGTKSRAHNSKKNNFNAKKIARHLKYIEDKTQEYLDILEQNDTKEDALKVERVQEKIERLKKNKINYELLSQKLEASGEPQISTTDKDARVLLVQGQVVEVSYNIQAAVDDKYKLVVATHTINRNDRNALSSIALEAKQNMESDTFVAIADKGYYNGSEIHACTAAAVTTIVAPQDEKNAGEKGPGSDYVVSKFKYNPEDDSYTCPQGERLYSTGVWYKKTKDKNSPRIKRYRTPQCTECPLRNLCTTKADGRREIERSEYAADAEANNKRYKENPELYRKRQEINEHIFGTIKRQWGYNHTNLKGLKKVNGEHSLIMLVYNIKRCINILGMEDLLLKLKNWKPNYDKIARLLLKWLYFKLHYGDRVFLQSLAA